MCPAGPDWSLRVRLTWSHCASVIHAGDTTTHSLSLRLSIMLHLVNRFRRLFSSLRQAFDNSPPKRRRQYVRLHLEDLEGRVAPATALLGGGVLSRLGTNVIEYSRDYTHLDGGGDSEQAYDGKSGALSITALRAGDGVLAQNNTTHVIFRSPDGTHLTGGGQSQQVYDGAQGALNLFPLYDGGVLVQV